MDFVFAGIPTRVIFGAGRLRQAHEEAERLGIKAAMLIVSERQADAVASVVGGIKMICTDAVMHTPVAVTETILAQFQREDLDGVIAVGGGSVIGLSKAIALRTGVPQVVVPTTYSGSEMTNILGETANGAKTTIRDPRIQPETVIYDPDLTASLPAGLSATSGMNAIAHAVEALYAKDTNPVIFLMAEEGIRALASSLPNIEASRSEALYGAWLCGTVLGQAGMALHHKLCHVLGGSFNLPHSDTHTVILPHAVAYNAEATPQAMARIARALGVPSAARGLFDLARHLKAPTSLQELGFREDNIVIAADLAVANPYWNPREITREGILKLLNDAFHGVRPNA